MMVPEKMMKANVDKMLLIEGICSSKYYN